MLQVINNKLFPPLSNLEASILHPLMIVSTLKKLLAKVRSSKKNTKTKQRYLRYFKNSRSRPIYSSSVLLNVHALGKTCLPFISGYVPSKMPCVGQIYTTCRIVATVLDTNQYPTPVEVLIWQGSIHFTQWENHFPREIKRSYPVSRNQWQQYLTTVYQVYVCNSI